MGVSTNDMTNGTLRMGWCRSGNGATTITVRYDKYSGSNISVQFGYRWTNSTAGNVGGTHWDASASNVVTVKAGEKWGARFKRSPAEQPPNGQACIQGLMKVAGQQTYITHTLCR